MERGGGHLRRAAPATSLAAANGAGRSASDAEEHSMTRIESALAPTVAAAPAAPAMPRRRVTDYIVPPVVVPAALSIVLLIYMLVRGPA
jgi:hypothetical protein